MTIELVVFACPESDRLMNYSPFCVKVEALLRLAKIPYTRREFKGNPASLPKGKLPIIVDNGVTVADSYFIYEHLKKLPGYPLDKNLDAKQHADGFAFIKLCEEFLYWMVLHERWGINENWAKVREIYFSGIPALVRGPVTSLIRRGTLKAAQAQGISRHSEEEIFLLAEHTLKTVGEKLTQPFLFSTAATSYDAALYGFLVNIMEAGDINPRLHKIASSIGSIPKFCDAFYDAIK